MQSPIATPRDWTITRRSSPGCFRPASDACRCVRKNRPTAIFSTPSKSDAGLPIGVSGVRVVVEATGLPSAAIGGIDLTNLPRVRETGAAMAAVISALICEDPEAAARAFVARWG